MTVGAISSMPSRRGPGRRLRPRTATVLALIEDA